MNLKERFPLLAWFLGRSGLYYVLTAIIFWGSIQFYLWDYFRLRKLEQLNSASSGKNPYTTILYYDHLTRLGVGNDEVYVKLAMSYLTVGDLKSGAKACQKALKFIPPQAKEYPAILECSKQ